MKNFLFVALATLTLAIAGCRTHDATVSGGKHCNTACHCKTENQGCVCGDHKDACHCENCGCKAVDNPVTVPNADVDTPVRNI